MAASKTCLKAPSPPPPLQSPSARFARRFFWPYSPLRSLVPGYFCCSFSWCRFLLFIRHIAEKTYGTGGRTTRQVYSKQLAYNEHRLRKKRRISVPKRGRAFTRWKKKEKSGYGTDFYPFRSEKEP